MARFETEVGKAMLSTHKNKYLGRVLRNGTLVWQSRRSHATREEAERVAGIELDRLEEIENRG